MESLTADALTEEAWDNAYFMEYIRDSRFRRYMGTDMNSVIQMNEELTGKPGTAITFPLITRLSGDGVTGNAVLDGSEEDLSNYGHRLQIDWLRNGVRIPKSEQKKTGIPLREAAKGSLKNWSMEKLRDHVIRAMGSVARGTWYADAAEVADKDAWLAANADRVLFGALKGNNSGNDHSASLANIDNTSDKLTAGTVSLAKRMAKTADPHIRPIRTTEDEEWFVMFAASMSFRDLKSDLGQTNREAWTRGKSNPLFRDGDLIYDGVIIREVPEIAVLSGVGASSIDVAPNYLCGAQAVGVGWGQRPQSKQDPDKDYGFRPGVALEELRGVEKLFFNDVQHGMVTVYTAGVADA